MDARPYPDHHPITPADLTTWPPGPVLMTDKDAVKCAAFAGPDLWVCPVEAVPDQAFVTAVFARIGTPPDVSAQPSGQDELGTFREHRGRGL